MSKLHRDVLAPESGSLTLSGRRVVASFRHACSEYRAGRDGGEYLKV